MLSGAASQAQAKARMQSAPKAATVKTQTERRAEGAAGRGMSSSSSAPVAARPMKLVFETLDLPTNGTFSDTTCLLRRLDVELNQYLPGESGMHEELNKLLIKKAYAHRIPTLKNELLDIKDEVQRKAESAASLFVGTTKFDKTLRKSATFSPRTLEAFCSFIVQNESSIKNMQRLYAKDKPLFTLKVQNLYDDKKISEHEKTILIYLARGSFEAQPEEFESIPVAAATAIHEGLRSGEADRVAEPVMVEGKGGLFAGIKEKKDNALIQKAMKAQQAAEAEFFPL